MSDDSVAFRDLLRLGLAVEDWDTHRVWCARVEKALDDSECSALVLDSNDARLNHDRWHELLEAAGGVLSDYTNEVGHVGSVSRLFNAVQDIDPDEGFPGRVTRADFPAPVPGREPQEEGSS